MKKYLLKIIIFFIFLSLISVPVMALAANIDLGFDVFADDIGLGTRDIRETIASLINQAIALLGVIALVVILFGGFRWMIAGGDQEKVKKAKDTLISGVIGLIIILTSYSLANFVVNSLLKAT